MVAQQGLCYREREMKKRRTPLISPARWTLALSRAGWSREALQALTVLLQSIVMCPAPAAGMENALGAGQGTDHRVCCDFLPLELR